MTLTDLTDSKAVLDAIAECDELGRDRFLSKYGFKSAREYFLEYNGRRYDSKAIVGAAHGFQHGRPLTWDVFSGGRTTVARKLADLGFYVSAPSNGWDIPIGSITTRTEVAAQYGGAIYGGIEPSTTSPNVFVYTDVTAGEEHGYAFDGSDASEPGVFYYSGEGQVGDQEMKNGNRAVLEHEAHGRVLRLFQVVDGVERPGGKLQRYMGAFRVDDENPYRFEPAPDKTGTMRQVIVFRLTPVELLAVPVQPLDPPNYVRLAPTKKGAFAPKALCPEHFVELSVTGVCAMCD